MRSVRRIVEMIAAGHRRQDRLRIGTDGKRIRLAHHIHGKLVGPALRVLVQLHSWQEHGGDPSAVAILPEPPWARSRQIHVGLEPVLFPTEDLAQRLLWIETFICAGERSADSVEVRHRRLSSRQVRPPPVHDPTVGDLILRTSIFLSNSIADAYPFAAGDARPSGGQTMRPSASGMRRLRNSRENDIQLPMAMMNSTC